MWGVPKSWGIPKLWMAYSRKSKTKMDDFLGYPHDFGKLHILEAKAWPATTWRFIWRCENRGSLWKSRSGFKHLIWYLHISVSALLPANQNAGAECTECILNEILLCRENGMRQAAVTCHTAKILLKFGTLVPGYPRLQVDMNRGTVSTEMAQFPVESILNPREDFSEISFQVYFL